MSERNLRIWLLAERSSRALQRMMQQCGTGQRQAWEVIRKSRPHSIDCVLEIACNCRFQGVDSGRSTWSASIGDICRKKHKVTLRPREGIAHLMTAVTHSSKSDSPIVEKPHVSQQELSAAQADYQQSLTRYRTNAALLHDLLSRIPAKKPRTPRTRSCNKSHPPSTRIPSPTTTNWAARTRKQTPTTR
jgi:hypothetical protein